MLRIGLFIINGFLASFLFFKSKDSDKPTVHLVEFSTIALVLSLVIYGLLVLLLASFNCLEIAKLLITEGIVSLVLLGMNIIIGRKQIVHFSPTSKSLWVVLGLVLLITAVYFFPAESIGDGRDHGIYAYTAAAMVKQGGVVWKWDNIAPLYSSTCDSIFWPDIGGLMSDKNNSLKVVSQGFNFLPSVLTLGFIMHDLEGLSYIYILIGILNTLITFWFIYRFFEGNIFIALLGTFFFTLSMAVISSTRNGLSEPLSNLLIAAVLLVILIQKKSQNKKLFSLILLLLLACFLNHITNLVILVPLSVLLFAYYMRGLNIQEKGFFIGVLLIIGLSSLYNLEFDYTYLIATKSFIYLTGGCVLAVIFLLFFLKRVGFFRLVKQYLEHGSILIFVVLPSTVALFLFYLYFVRPYWDIFEIISADQKFFSSEGSRWSLYRFGYYITPFGIFGALLGFAIWQKKEFNAITIEKGVVVLSIVLFSILFLLFSTVTDTHFFAARRYTVLILPGFLMFFSYFIFALFQMKSIIGKAIAVLLCSYLLYTEAIIAKPFVTLRPFEGSNKFIRELDHRIPADYPVLIDGGLARWMPISPILKFVYNRNVIPLANADVLDRYRKYFAEYVSSELNRGHRLFYLAPSYDFTLPLWGHTQFVKQFDLVFDAPSTERVPTIPKQIIYIPYHLSLYEIKKKNLSQVEIYDLMTHGKWSGLYQDKWTDDTSTVFLANLDMIPEIASLFVDFDRPHIPGIPKESVEVYFNNNYVKTLTFDTACIENIVIPQSMLAKDEDKAPSLSFYSKYGFVPKTLKFGDDLRKLYFHIRRCELKLELSELEAGDTIVISGEMLYKQLLNNGLFPPEGSQQSIIWTKEKAVFGINLSGIDSSARTISIKCGSGRPANVPSPRLVIYINQSLVYDGKLTNPEIKEYLFSIPREVKLGINTEIKLLQDVWVPSKYIHASDMRALGIRLEKISLY